MNNKNFEIINNTMFAEYPDVVTVTECAEMLRICKKTVYSLVQKGKLEILPGLHKYCIVKMSIINYVLKTSYAA